MGSCDEILIRKEDKLTWKFFLFMFLEDKIMYPLYKIKHSFVIKKTSISGY